MDTPLNPIITESYICCHCCGLVSCCCFHTDISKLWMTATYCHRYDYHIIAMLLTYVASVICSRQGLIN